MILGSHIVRLWQRGSVGEVSRTHGPCRLFLIPACSAPAPVYQTNQEQRHKLSHHWQQVPVHESIANSQNPLSEVRFCPNAERFNILCRSCSQCRYCLPLPRPRSPSPRTGCAIATVTFWFFCSSCSGECYAPSSAVIPSAWEWPSKLVGHAIGLADTSSTSCDPGAAISSQVLIIGHTTIGSTPCEFGIANRPYEHGG